MREMVRVVWKETSEIVSVKTRGRDVKTRGREMTRAFFACLSAALDSLAMIFGFQLVGLVRDYQWLAPGGVPLLFILIPAYIYLAIVFGGFSTWTLSSISKSTTSAFRALIGAAAVVIVCAFLAQFGTKISRLAFLYAILGSGCLLVLSRVVIALLIRFAMQGKTVSRLLISDGIPANESYGPEISFLDVKSLGATPDLHDPARMAEFSHFLCQYDIVYLDGRRIDDVAPWITVIKATGVACQLVVPSRDIHSAVGIGLLGDNDTLVLSRGPLSFGSRLQKRLFDLALVIPLLVLTAPLMIATAIAIRLETRGPALFTQQRTGLANRPFQIFKFRSMHVDKLDERGDRSAARDDDRITRVGRFIRKSSIDEIPQLFNVLLGNMSLVGPRPHAEGSRAGDQLFWEVSDAYWLRHGLKPGITGLAQIRGYRGATHNRSDLESRLRYDLEYLETWSLWNDITILFATLKVVSHANAY